MEPPINAEAEAAVLGAILANNRAMDLCIGLEAHHFAFTVNQEIFRACQRRISLGRKVDAVTLKGVFENSQLFAGQEHGASGYLAHLLASLVGIDTAGDYARAIMDCAQRRRLIKIAQEINDRAYATSLQDEMDATAIGAWAQSELDDMAADATSSNAGSMADAVAGAVRQSEAAQRGEQAAVGLMTGIASLDEMWGGLHAGSLDILGARSKTGKAQPLDAHILMRDGTWRTMGEIAVGDQLASIDGLPSEVTGVFPRGSMPIYAVHFSDGRVAKVTVDHLWTVHYHRWPEARVLPTGEVIELLRLPKYRRRLWIDTVSGDFGTEEHLPIDPYVLGCLLGDGDVSQVTPRLTSADPSLVAEVGKRLAPSAVIRQCGSDGISYSIISAVFEMGTRPDHRRKKREMHRALVSLGLFGCVSETKFIPEIYLRASRSVRLDLLRGLMDTDGWTEVRTGGVGFSSCSKKLAEGVQRLVRSLGGYCRLKSKQAYFRVNGERRMGQIQTLALIRYARPQDLFLLQRKKDRAFRTKEPPRITFEWIIEQSGIAPAQCISVSHSTGLYVTDDYAVTHNTAFALQIARRVAYEGDFVAILSLEMSGHDVGLFNLASLSGVSADSIRRGKYNTAQAIRIIEAQKELAALPIEICDQPRLTLADGVAFLRGLKRKRNLRLAVVDHRNLFGRDAGFERTPRLDWYGEVTQRLKNTAKMLNIAVLLLVQINRSVESRDDPRPRVADLEYGGEQDADNVVLLYRPELHFAAVPPKRFNETEEHYANALARQYQERQKLRGTGEVILAKRRFGAEGICHLNFVGHTMTWVDPAADQSNLGIW